MKALFIDYQSKWRIVSFIVYDLPGGNMSTAIGEGVYYAEQVHPGFHDDVFNPSVRTLLGGQILSGYVRQVAPRLGWGGRRHIDTTIEKIRAIIPLLRQESGSMEVAMFRLLTDYDGVLQDKLSEAGYAKAAPFMRKRKFVPIDDHEYEHTTHYTADGTPIDVAVDVTPSEIERRKKKQEAKHKDQEWSIACITAAYARFLFDNPTEGVRWALTRIYGKPSDYQRARNNSRSFPRSFLSIIGLGGQFCTFEPLNQDPGGMQFEKDGVFKKTWETPTVE